MGRVLVNSSLPSKVFVKFDDDYEYAYDANNNLVLVQPPKSKGRPTTRGERVASVVGNVAGIGRSLLQPANTFSQFLSNLRTGAQLGGQDVRGLYRNFLETRGARRRAENRQAVADRNERQDELFRQALERGQIGLEGFRFGGPTRRQREQGLDRLRDVQDTAGQRQRDMQEVGREIFERQAQISGTGIEGVTLADAQQYMANQNALLQAGAQRGDRIDVPESVPLPSPTEQQTNDLLTELQRAAAPIPVGPVINKPMPGTVSKPSGKVQVVNARGEIQGNVGTSESVNRLNAIQPPSNNMGAADANEEPIPPTTTVNPAMDRFNQMKPESDEEEGGQQQQPSMLRTSIEEKMRGFGTEVEA